MQLVSARILNHIFGLVWFYGTSTIAGYLMSNPFLYISVSKVKLATAVEGDQKAPFAIATTPWIAPLYPWYIPYIAEC